MPRREPLHMHLIDDGPVPGNVELPISAPGERLVNDDALGDAPGIVSGIERQISLVIADPVAKHRVRPFDHSGNGFRVGIEEQLVRIEAMPLFRRIWSVDTISIVLPWPQTG